MMYKDWLKKECNIKLHDYKRLSSEEKLELYKEWMSTVQTELKCPHCGSPMLCGYPAWEGRNSYVELSMAMVASPVTIGEQKILTPTIHICDTCGFVGLFLNRKERAIFKDTCCDLKYHE